MKSLFDELVDALEGEVDVSGDVAALKVDAVLDRLGQLSPVQLATVTEQIDALVESATSDLRAVEVRHAVARATVDDWNQRAGESAGTLADEARERARSYASALADLDAELAEYRTTIERLAAIRDLVTRGSVIRNGS